MTRIIIEEDHFLKIVPVVLDPATPEAHRLAVADFFSHDEPDFLGWCGRLQQRLGGLYPAQVIFAADEADLAAKIGDADGVVVESFRIDDAVLAAAPRLAVVHKFGTITTNIDLEACARRGIPVSTLRRVVNVAVAEQACALMLALAKRIGEFNGVVEEAALRKAGLRVRPRQPHYIGYSNFAGVTGLKTLLGATLGIVGFGEVGREVARRARAFEMEIVYFQRTQLAAAVERELDVRYLPLDGLMEQADYILVQLPSNDKTRGLIGRDALSRIKPGAVLIDVARPELIDHDALVEALQAGRLGGLGLDVLYSEPADPAEPLLRYRDRNVILMPHTAVASRANALRDVETLCVNLWRAITKKRGRC
ncbi:MAG TPA: NAD(P)-dependent oxidoreductase [Xanthobacteraceae bacterium]|jgi:glyoxylate reductase|nr:NAD(P)-dependent oxidoreductase [Xanthobacteraceae bacterium]